MGQKMKMYEEDEAEAKAEAEASLPAGLPAAVTTNEDLMKMLVTLVAQQTTSINKLTERNESGPTPQIPYAAAKWQTPWNPTGERYRRELKRATYLNGHRIEEITLSQDEIDLFNQLKPGKYHNREWIVIEKDGGDEGSSLEIFLPNKKPEHRLALAQIAGQRGVSALLEAIIKEQSAVTLA